MGEAQDVIAHVGSYVSDTNILASLCMKRFHKCTTKFDALQVVLNTTYTHSHSKYIPIYLLPIVIMEIK